ncbi:hypothetical protein [Psychrobacter phenylpyruvicus]|uniref:Lipoprotein n=1 Tax=Psychrobacter phenylpyruvicus TaxID=29432 RepID=A0A379LQ12_9GAMM|nr:hypothetical protein [Psychrobacter phenylpyruvicus]SUD91854.1 Uncharacterised protein [Psychrobacter phenylpyruvicus]
MPKLSVKSLMTSAAVVGSILVVSGCASTGNVSPQYIPPSTYQNYNCASLSQEYQRIQSYINTESRNYSGLTTTGIGVGVSAGRWGISPNINIGVGKSTNNSARDAKLSRLFGERDAVIQSARMKQCAFAAKLKIYGES